MATLRLNDRRVDALKLHKSTYDIRDRDLKGFGVRVLTSGAKRYFIYRPAPRPASLEDRRPRRSHRRWRGSQAGQGTRRRDPEGERRRSRRAA